MASVQYACLDEVVDHTKGCPRDNCRQLVNGQPVQPPQVEGLLKCEGCGGVFLGEGEVVRAEFCRRDRARDDREAALTGRGEPGQAGFMYDGEHGAGLGDGPARFSGFEQCLDGGE